MAQLAAGLTSAFENDPNQPFSAGVFRHNESQSAFEFIEGFDERSCLILIGHSQGASTAMSLAGRMGEGDRTVALLVQFDSAGYLDGPLPNRVTKGVNYFQDAEGVDFQGRRNVPPAPRSENYEVEAVYDLRDDSIITHTNIDDARFGFDLQEYTTLFGNQEDLHARIKHLIIEGCSQ